MNRITGFAPMPDAALYYEVQGKGEPVLFIHGFLLDHTLWDECWHHPIRNHQTIHDSRCSAFLATRITETIGRRSQKRATIFAELSGWFFSRRIGTNGVGMTGNFHPLYFLVMLYDNDRKFIKVRVMSGRWSNCLNERHLT